MFNTEVGRRKMALSITIYAYRDTAIEDYHSKGVKMDMEFYNKIYKIVYRKIERVKKLQKYIDIYPGDKIETREELEKLMEPVPDDLRFKFMKYAPAILDVKYLPADWDAAKVVEMNLNGKSLAHYILSGSFSDHCKKGAVLDDKAMCCINKDVHNRIYTLLVNGKFN